MYVCVCVCVCVCMCVVVSPEKMKAIVAAGSPSEDDSHDLHTASDEDEGTYRATPPHLNSYLYTCTCTYCTCTAIDTGLSLKSAPLYFFPFFFDVGTYLEQNRNQKCDSWRFILSVTYCVGDMCDV